MQLPRYLPELDVLRGFAILAVMFHHVGKNLPALHLLKMGTYGWAGVDLFFVLSGFLITGILLEAKGKAHYFRNFYARRILRIWPLYYALLLFAFVLLPLALPSLREQIFQDAHPWESYIFFLQNLLCAKPIGFGPVGVTWSLAIEEQYYLAWPFLVLILSPRALKFAAIGAFTLSVTIRILQAFGLLHLMLYTNTFSRLDGIALGSLLAVALPYANERTVRRVAMMVLPSAVVAVVITEWIFGEKTWFLYSGLALAFASILCLSINSEPLRRMRFLAYTGKISYALYLLHVPVFDLFRLPRLRARLEWFHSPVANDLLLLVCMVTAVYLAASASWYFFESPILKLKRRFATPATARSASAIAAEAEVASS
ncbi:MAG TPA: acyltransferase [Candidatus Angelobacter sp.]|nr:acyltransferase [Candidatus Angelobacter sp.]